MEKTNDMVLNMLANPKFEARDFQSVGLTSENTNLLSEEDYLKSDKILKNEALLDEQGNFDKEKFHKVYNQAGLMYNQLAHDNYRKTIMDSALFSEDNIWAKPTQRKISYKPKLTRSPNETLVTSSLDGVGKRGERTKSISEIAQTLKVYNTETGEWEESPNDAFFGHLFDTLVLATYDEDVFDEETGQKIHNKGDRKLNDEGLPYYETLGGRNPHDKQILNKMNTFTKDGSFANKFDFFDSDDIEQKSWGGTLLKNAALVGSMFIPYVGPYVTAASVLTQTLGLSATLGKLLAGSDSPTFNNLQGWAKSVSRQASTEYAQENTWCGENFLNMIGDTIGQLAEQRWIFKAGPTLLTGSTKPYKALSDKGRQKLIEQTAKEMLESGSGATLENLMKSLSTKEGQQRLAKEGWEALVKRLNDINASLAATSVDNMLEKAMKVSAPLSKVYMTGITVQDTYDEAKAAGASDMEAALLTLGYAGAEMALLNTEVGEWIMPELHGDRFKREAIAEALANKMMPEKTAEQATKVGWVQSILKLGRDIANRKYSKQLITGGKTSKVVAAHALGESFEEVSEEVLADVSKSIFNVTRWLRGEDALDMGQWDNMADRYAMSALGGFIGGGLNSAATDFATAKNLQNMSRTQALQELIYMINNGKEGDFLKTVDKMTLGNKDLSGDALNDDSDTIDRDGLWKPAKNIEDSQDYQVKQAIKNQVAVLKSILNSEGARLSTDSLISTLTLENQNAIMKDMKMSGLKNATSIDLYLQGFQNLQDELVAVKSELMQLEQSKPDSGDYDLQTKDRMALLNQRLLKIREDKNAYLSGKKSGEFVRDALFEMNPALSNFLIKANEVPFLEEFWGKKIGDMSEAEKEYGMLNFEKYSRTSMKNDIHRAAQTYHNMIVNATALVQQQLELLKQQALDAQGVIDGNNYLQQLLEQANIDAQYADVDIESAMGAIQTKLQNRSRELMQIQAIPYLPQATLDIMNDLLALANTPISGESETEFKNRQKKLVNKYLETMWEGMADNIDAIMQPIVKQPYLNPELKNGLKTLVSRIRQYYNNKKQDIAQAIADVQFGNDPLAIQKLGFADEVEATKAKKDASDKADMLLNYLTELEVKTNSPIIDFISQFQKVATNSDLDLTKHWEDTIKMFEESGEDPNEIMVEDAWVEDNKEALKLVDAFESVLLGMRVDNADYNNPTGYTKILNQVNSKIGNTDLEPLAEIDQHEADLMLQDIHTMKSRLELALSISDINRGQKLKVQEKVATRKNFLLYKELSKLKDVAPEKWRDKGTEEQKRAYADFIAALDAAEFLKANYKEDNLQFSKEERSKGEKEMLDIEDAVYNLFNSHKSSDGSFDVKDLGDVIRSLAGTNGYFAKTGEHLTENSKSMDVNSFIWWLAARASVRATDFYTAYRDSATKEKAPIASQEMATYLGVAALTNMDVLNQFVDAYRDTVITDFKAMSLDERKTAIKGGDEGFANKLLDYFGGSDYLPQYKNMIFIEGAPGTGKSKGVFHNVKRVAEKINKDILKNAWYVHVTEDSAKDTIDALELEGAKAFDKNSLMNKIVEGYVELKPEILRIPDGVDKDGKETSHEEKGTKLKDGSYGFNEQGQLVNTLKLKKYSSDELPNVIFIDEVSHYNEQELSAIEQFAKENQIIVLTAGDLQQNTQVAYADIPGLAKNVSTTLTRNKMIRCTPLGVSLRSRNKPIDDSMAVIKTAFKNIDEEGGGSHDYHLYYSENQKDRPGLYGIKVITSSNQDDISDEAFEQAKKTVDNMMSTLKDGEKIGYITDYSDSKLAKYLEDTYKGKYEKYSGSQAQGREGQYYIVENDRRANNDDSAALAYLRSLYTGVSRAEQGVLLIGGQSNIGRLGKFDSEEVQDLQITNLSTEAIERQYNVRMEQLQKALEDKTPDRIEWKKPTRIESSTPVAPTPPTTVTTPAGPITSSPLPPALPSTPAIPRRIGTAYTDRSILEGILTRLSSRVPADTKVKDGAGEEYTFKGFDIVETGEDPTTGASLFEPVVKLEDKDGTEVVENLADFKANYTPYTPTAIVPIYEEGEQMSLTSGENVEVLSIDTTDPNNPQYIVKNLETGDERTISQSELQGLYKGAYVPEETKQPETITLTGLENLQGTEYEQTLTAANIDIEPAIDKEAEHIIHKLYTFNTFDLGMHEENGKAVFNNPGNDPKVAAKFKTRIDNLIGLSKILGTTDYNRLVGTLALLKNHMYDIEDNSDLASKIAEELGLKGTTTIRYGLKSTMGRRDNGKYTEYDRYDMDVESEELPYMFSDDMKNAVIPMRKKLVMVVNNNGKNVLEISAGSLNSPLTLVQEETSEGQLVYPDALNTFMSVLQQKPRQYYEAAKEVVDKHSAQYPELTDLFKLWMFTSNGMFYMDPDFNLASMQSTGPQLDKQRGEHVWERIYDPKNRSFHLDIPLGDFTSRLIDIAEFALHPQRRVSSIMMATDSTIDDKKIPGLNAGHSFVLVANSNKYKKGDDAAMVQQWIKLQLNPDLKKEVKLVYVSPPTATVGDWLMNLHNIYTNRLSEGSKYKTMELLFDIGNDFTAFRVIEAMIDNGKFDEVQALDINGNPGIIESSDGTKENVKQAIQELKAIEAKWQGDLDLNNDNKIYGRGEKDYYDWLLSQGYSEKEARRHMATLEQKSMLDKIVKWNNPATVGKTLSQALSSYLTNLVWHKNILGQMIEDPNIINSRIQAIEEAAKGKMDRVYYKAQYSDDKVYGNFIKVLVKAPTGTETSYNLGKTPFSKTDAAFKINGKIDTPVFILKDFHKVIKDIADHIYFDGTLGVWAYNGKYKDEEKMYLDTGTAPSGTPTPPSISEIVRLKYAKQLPYLNQTIINSSAYRTEQDMLEALAKDFNTKPGNYGFVYNGKLYLTKHNFTFTNPEVRVTSTENIEIKNAKDSQGNLCDLILTVNTDSSNPTAISQVAISSVTSYNVIKTPNLDNITEADFAKMKDILDDPNWQLLVDIMDIPIKLDGTLEEFKLSITDWMYENGQKVKDLDIQNMLGTTGLDQSVINKLIDYYSAEAPVMLVGDVVLNSNKTIRYQILSTSIDPATLKEVVYGGQLSQDADGNDIVDTENPVVLELNNMIKEEIECKNIKLQIL